MCREEALPTQTGNGYHGLDISWGMMGLFTSIGHSSPPQCTCSDLNDLSQEIDHFIENYSTGHGGDYMLHTGKNDESEKEAINYAFRDTLLFWSIWNGLPHSKHGVIHG